MFVGFNDVMTTAGQTKQLFIDEVLELLCGVGGGGWVCCQQQMPPTLWSHFSNFPKTAIKHQKADRRTTITSSNNQATVFSVLYCWINHKIFFFYKKNTIKIDAVQRATEQHQNGQKSPTKGLFGDWQQHNNP